MIYTPTVGRRAGDSAPSSAGRAGCMSRRAIGAGSRPCSELARARGRGSSWSPTGSGSWGSATWGPRDGHPHRQALALHCLRRHCPGLPPGHPGRRHGQRRAARRSALHRSRQPRLRGEEYGDLVDEFVTAVEAPFPVSCCSSRTSPPPTRFGCWPAIATDLRLQRRHPGHGGGHPRRALFPGRVTGRRRGDERLLSWGRAPPPSASPTRRSKHIRRRRSSSRPRPSDAAGLFHVEGLLARTAPGSPEARRRSRPRAPADQGLGAGDSLDGPPIRG